MTSQVLTSTAENKATYRRFVEEVINEGRSDVVDELFSPAYVDHNRPPGAPEGLDGVRAIPKMFRGAFPDVHFTIEQMVAEGDLVATLVTGRGTHQGPFMGIAPTGRQATWASMGFFRVAGGRIVEHWGSPDLLTLLIQLGAIPAPGGGQPAGPPTEPAVAPARPPGAKVDPEEGKRILRHHVEDVFNRHDLSELDDWLAPGYIYRAMGMEIRGLDGYKSTVEPLFVAFPDVRNTIEQLIAEDDLVATRWRARGTHLGPFMGIQPTGKPVELTGMTIERIAGGKRLEGWGVPDMLTLMGQIGVGPAARS
ncbi:MAG TPA: ester cyclase [Candidatus Limnocylindrales bacterium]